MKNVEEHSSLRIIPLREKLIRLVLLAFLFAFCYIIVDIFSYDIVMYVVGCSYIYIFYCVMKGERIFPAFFYKRNKNRN